MVMEKPEAEPESWRKPVMRAEPRSWVQRSGWSQWREREQWGRHVIRQDWIIQKDFRDGQRVQGWGIGWDWLHVPQVNELVPPFWL